MVLFRGFSEGVCCTSTGLWIKTPVPVCSEVVVAEDPKLLSEELPKGAEGGACSVGNKPEPTPWATPNPHREVSK